jgi:hypothetical protein
VPSVINFSLVALIFVFTIPLGATVLTLLCRPEHHRRVCLAGIGVVMIGLLALFLGGEADILTGLTFMGEPIIFSISNTAILLYASTLLPLGYLVWRNPPDETLAMTPYQWSLLHLSLSAGFVAFISGQFMIRYIALDVVGLLAAMTVLTSFSVTSGLKQFIIIFQILRLGDLSLLASILLINHFSGTLEIGPMIAAAAEMPPNARLWVFLGFLMALWIKMAVWPFGIWQEKVHRHAPSVTFWISGLMIPALGYYLLYRITPIINSAAIFQRISLFSALALVVLMILLNTIKQIRYARFSQLGGVMSCFLLAAIPFSNGKLLVYYLMGLLLHRWLMLLEDEVQKPALRVLTVLFPLLLNSLWLGFNYSGFPPAVSLGWMVVTVLVVAWDLYLQYKPEPKGRFPEQVGQVRLEDQPYGGFLVNIAEWLNNELELAVFTQGPVKFAEFFEGLAGWVYRNVEGQIEKLWISIGRLLVALSEGTLSNVEGRIEKLWISIGNLLVALSEGTLRKVEEDATRSTTAVMGNALNSLADYEKNVLKKSLRWDLAWIPFLLVMILVMLFVL